MVNERECTNARDTNLFYGHDNFDSVKAVKSEVGRK